MKTFKILLLTVLAVYSLQGYSQTIKTKRIPQLSNQRVQVWKTIIYPTGKQRLRRHRHEHDRVVVALSDGLLKISNNQGKIHYLKLQKGQSYYLQKDPVKEYHSDENLGQEAIEVIVIELQ